MTDFYHVDEFEEDLRNLTKKYKHLDDDLENFKRVFVAKLPYTLYGSVRITYAGNEVKIPVYKARHFRSRDLKGKGVRSGFRVIYTYNEESDTLTLIEIYFKANKTNPDFDRIKKYCT